MEKIPPLPRSIHFIGICGVAMSALAIAFHRRGVHITGSDAGIYPPISTYLKKAGITYRAGWSAEKLMEDGLPELVIVGNAVGSQNPEWLFTQEKNLPFLSYPEAINKFFLRKNNLVAAGTYGKTTSAAALAYALERLHVAPSYMFGGLSTNPDLLPAAALTASDWAVFEGDEYKTAKWDEKAKFFHYHPTHLLLTAVEWDHADMYKTAEDYEQAFIDLVSGLPTEGLLVYHERVARQAPQLFEIIKNRTDLKKFSYGESEQADFKIRSIKTSLTESEARITGFTGEDLTLKSSLVGTYTIENLVGCLALLIKSGFPKRESIEALTHFFGLKRRLEKRLEQPILIIDDIAHSPAKFRSVISTLKSANPDAKIIAVFEPNQGNRERVLLKEYKDAFRDASMVILPRFTKVKIDPSKTERPLEAFEIADYLQSQNVKAQSFDTDAETLGAISKQAEEKSIVVFMGSHGFRGLIEKTVERFVTSPHQ